MVTPEQSHGAGGLEKDGTIHLALVYRGSTDNAAKFIEVQDKTLAALYPSKDADDTQGSEEGSMASQTAEAEGGVK
jgi:pilus assembly protein CpaB